MKKTGILLLIISLLSISLYAKNKVRIRSIEVNAPFHMSPIQIPDFSGCKKFDIRDFGAKPEDKESTSRAIESAIEKANKNGGGIVVIPTGIWLTKKIHFKSNVNLHLAKDAVLLFSEDPKDYLPAVKTTWEGMECYNYSPLIYAYNCENVAITGEGKLKAKLDVWEIWYDRPQAHLDASKILYDAASFNKPVEERQMAKDGYNFRPQFMQFNRCQRVLIEGISIENSPFWVLHPFLSKDVVIRKVNVHAHGRNNDGVDPEMTQNLLIEDCVFDQGDDAIAIKSGRNQDAWRLNTPSKNIVIRNCLVKNGHQLLAIGSEISGGVENVFMDNCEVVDGAKLNHLLYLKTNERRGGYIKNIYISNIKSGKIDKGILGIETDVLYRWKDLVPTYERRLTKIANIFLDQVHAKNVDFLSRVLGEEELPIQNVVLKNVAADDIREEKYISKNLHGFKVE